MSLTSNKNFTNNVIYQRTDGKSICIDCINENVYNNCVFKKYSNQSNSCNYYKYKEKENKNLEAILKGI
jgi:hypothetical protein